MKFGIYSAGKSETQTWWMVLSGPGEASVRKKDLLTDKSDPAPTCLSEINKKSHLMLSSSIFSRYRPGITGKQSSNCWCIIQHWARPPHLPGFNPLPIIPFSSLWGSLFVPRFTATHTPRRPIHPPISCSGGFLKKLPPFHCGIIRSLSYKPSELTN